jgi:hypothetical protein
MANLVSLLKPSIFPPASGLLNPAKPEQKENQVQWNADQI